MTDTDTADATLDPTQEYQRTLVLYKAAVIGGGFRWAMQQGVADTPANRREYKRYQRWNRAAIRAGYVPDIPYD
ncbi:MAG TPA: hypothetical protein VFB50_10475 [Chloroflexota bacterium]|nr:hypothetical protein [Chloroflexota bacterium]